MTTLIDKLNWPYATKRMTGKKIPGSKLVYKAKQAPTS